MRKGPYKKAQEHLEGTPVWQKDRDSVQTTCLLTDIPL